MQELASCWSSQCQGHSLFGSCSGSDAESLDPASIAKGWLEASWSLARRQVCWMKACHVPSELTGFSETMPGTWHLAHSQKSCDAKACQRRQRQDSGGSGSSVTGAYINMGPFAGLYVYILQTRVLVHVPHDMMTVRTQGMTSCNVTWFLAHKTNCSWYVTYT